MRVFITVWNGRVSPVFDVAKEAVVLEVDSCKISSEKKLAMTCETNIERVEFVLDLKIDTVICGAVSRNVEMSLVEKGVTVHSFISGDISDVIQGLKEERLSEMKFAMPGCRRNRKIKICNDKKNLKFKR